MRESVVQNATFLSSRNDPGKFAGRASENLTCLAWLSAVKRSGSNRHSPSK